MTLIEMDNRFFPVALRQRADHLLQEASEMLRAIQEKTCLGREFTGWFDWPRHHGKKLLQDCRGCVDSISDSYDLVLVIGIGGSYLGSRTVVDALQHAYVDDLSVVDRRYKKVAFAGHHMSELGLSELLDLLEKRKPIVNVISKSGTTTEPGVAFRIIRSYMEQRFGRSEAARRVIATTDPDKGALRQQATQNNYRSFRVPPDVGGRFSVLTAVGLVPLALAGFDVEQLLNGANALFEELTEAPERHPVVRYASARKAAYEQGYGVEILNVSEPKLTTLVEWWKQLFGESEGKDGQGLLPMGLISSTDLHSLGQFVQEGPRILFETFLSFGATQGRSALGGERRLRIPQASSDLDQLGYLEGRCVEDVNAAITTATRLAHSDGKTPNLLLELPALDEFHLGALFAFFQTACGVSAALLGVNPYNQPGVEAYKQNLFGLLGKPGFTDMTRNLRDRIKSVESNRDH